MNEAESQAVRMLAEYYDEHPENRGGEQQRRRAVQAWNTLIRAAGAEFGDLDRPRWEARMATTTCTGADRHIASLWDEDPDECEPCSAFAETCPFHEGMARGAARMAEAVQAMAVEPDLMFGTLAIGDLLARDRKVPEQCAVCEETGRNCWRHR